MFIFNPFKTRESQDLVGGIDSFSEKGDDWEITNRPSFEKRVPRHTYFFNLQWMEFFEIQDKERMLKRKKNEISRGPSRVVLIERTI